MYLTAYVHLNPVRAGLIRRPEDWIYSSYREYLGVRAGTLPRTELVLSLCGGKSGYRSFVESLDEDSCPEHKRILIED